jgi:tryptophan synthase alpha chain
MKQIVTHVVLGYPSIAETEALVAAMVESGIRIVELQIPFSDPIADGPTVSKANIGALEAGMTVKKSFEVAQRLCKTYPEVDFYFMTYGNIVYNFGIQEFCKQAEKIGISGMIIPDIPWDSDDGKLLNSACKDNGLSNVLVVSPGYNQDLTLPWVEQAQGFIYLTSTKGTTGAVSSLSEAFKDEIDTLRNHTQIPIGIGFGISKPEHVADVCTVANYAIIGSHIINVFLTDGVDGVKKRLGELLR